MDQKLLKKVAERLGKSPKYVREQASRRAGREGVVSDVALINMARDLSIGVATAVKKLEAQYQQQLSAPRVVTTRAPAGRPAPVRRKTTAEPKKLNKPKTRVLVFISHSSEDKRIATHLVDLLRSAFSLSAERIRATSVAGHKLDVGADTDVELLKEVLGCEVLIGIITPSSRKSTYVLLELGARWGAGKKLLPLTACGVTPGELKGPLGQTNGADCNTRTDVLQLISNLGTMLGMQPEKPEVFDRDVTTLVRASKTATNRGALRQS